MRNTATRETLPAWQARARTVRQFGGHVRAHISARIVAVATATARAVGWRRWNREEARYQAYLLLAAVLRCFPRPVWRLPAVIAATLWTPFDRQGRQVTGVLLPALGLPPTPWQRWRLRRSFAYHHCVQRLLLLQAEQVTMEGGDITRTVAGTPVGSIGKPFPDVTIRLVNDDDGDVPEGDVGELIVRSPTLMHDYAGNPQATARAIRDGRLYTGDRAPRR